MLATLKKIDLDFTGLKEIGRGRERRCFAGSRYPRLLFKCSLFKDCKESLREAYYYAHLKRRKVPMTHLPHFVKIFKTDKYVVSIQEYVTDSMHYKVHALESGLKEGRFDKDKLQRAYDELKAYLLKYRINTNDMFTHNFLVKIRKDGPNAGEYRLMLIDGVGAVTLIPLANYMRFLAVKRINKQCHKFVDSVKAASSGKIVLNF